MIEAGSGARVDCSLTHTDITRPTEPPSPSARAAVLEATERAATRRAQEALLQAMVETGAKEELLARLRERLQEAGWVELVKEHVKGTYCLIWQRARGGCGVVGVAGHPRAST